MAEVHVVTGPPAAGKTTFVAEHREPGDIAIDLDHIANTLAGMPADNHEHSDVVLAVARAARRAAIDAATKQDARVWIIHTKPTPEQLAGYATLDATIHTVDPGKTVVMKRCKTSRSRGSLVAAAQWYDEKGGKPQKKKRRGTRTERGYGYNDHVLPRERLLIKLKDGEPCWWCGLPMYRDKEKNWDGKPLARDHVEPGGAKNRSRADRLLHGNCNSQRRDGSDDWRRPAVTGAHPSQPLGSAPPAGEAFTW